MDGGLAYPRASSTRQNHARDWVRTRSFRVCVRVQTVTNDMSFTKVIQMKTGKFV